MEETVRLAQLVGLALGVGWMAERLVDTGLGVRGIGFLCGIAGLWVGSWLWGATGWAHGPAVAGEAILPGLAGALAIAVLLKLVGLGVAGPRR